MTERPQSDPPTDTLAALGEADRDAALRRFKPLRPRRQDAATLTKAARAASVPVHDDGKSGRRRGPHRDQRAHGVVLYRSRKHSVKQICSRIGISRATLYAYVEKFSKQA